MVKQAILTNQHLGWQAQKKRLLRQTLKSSHDFHELEEFKFKSKKEVEAYLSGDYVTCLICGNSYKSVGVHARSIHGIKACDYKEMFGIPQGYGLIGRKTKDKFSENGKRVAAKITDEERHRRIKLAQTSKKTRRKIPKGFATKNTNRSLVLKEKMCSLICQFCGTGFEKKLKMKPGKATCEGCRASKTSLYMKNWREKNYVCKNLDERNDVGERHHSAVLTENDVMEIRTLKLTPAQASKKYGISWPSAKKVISGQSWKHVTIKDKE